MRELWKRAAPVMFIAAVLSVVGNVATATGDEIAKSYAHSHFTAELRDCYHQENKIICNVQIEFTKTLGSFTINMDETNLRLENGLYMKAKEVRFARQNEWKKDRLYFGFFVNHEWPEYTSNPDKGFIDTVQFHFEGKTESEPVSLTISWMGTFAILSTEAWLSITGSFGEIVSLDATGKWR